MSELPDGNPKSVQGVKKPALHLVPPAATLEAAVRLMASPYGPYNWREHSIAMSVYISATKRHADSILDGEWIDPDCPNGTSHASGLITNGAILIDAHRTGNLIDDRPSPGVTAALIRAFKENGRLPE